MCGKFTFMATWAEVVDFSQPLVARPTNREDEKTRPMLMAPVLHLDEAGNRVQTLMRWGFTKRSPKGYDQPDLIHARNDKVATSPTWKEHFEKRRGILIVTSFNEGQEVPTMRGGKPTGNTKTVQWSIKPKDGSQLAIAVLFRDNPKALPQPVKEYVMCTTLANEGISKFVVADPDQRMPAVLREEDFPVWLGEVRAPLADVEACLRTYEDGGAWDMRPEGDTKGPGLF